VGLEVALVVALALETCNFGSMASLGLFVDDGVWSGTGLGGPTSVSVH